MATHRTIATIKRAVITSASITIVALALWVAHTLSGAAWSAQEVKAAVDTIKADATTFDVTILTDDVAELEQAATALREQTSTPGWQLLERAPITSDTIRATSALSAAASDLATATLPILRSLDAADANTAKVMTLLDEREREQITTLRAAANKAAADLREQSRGTLLFGLDATVEQTIETLDTLDSALDQLIAASDPLRAMLGAEEPTTWLVMSQNPAEVRGSGGLFNAYLIVSVSNGVPTIVEAGSRKALDSEFPRNEQIPYEQAIDKATVNTWGPALGEWASFNLAADFPTVAKLAAAGMARRGTPVDGVVAVDPAVVQAVLAGTGAVEHKGISIDKANAGDFFTKGLYDAFPGFDDVEEKDQIAMGLTYATMNAAFKRPLDLASLAAETKTAIENGHLKIWSAAPATQPWIAQTPVSGALTATPEDVVVGFNNATGNKLDAYATKTVRTNTERCLLERLVTTTITLKNDAPENLPDYVDTALGPDGLPDPAAPKGQTVTYVTAYPPADWQLRVATLNGSIVQPWRGQEAGRTAWTQPVTIPRGDQGELMLTFEVSRCPSTWATAVFG